MVAIILSLVAPGAGHLYAWRPRMAAAAFACHAATAAAVLALLPGSFHIALGAAIGMFVGAYLGIAIHAAWISHTRRAPLRPRGRIVATLVAVFVTISLMAHVFVIRWAHEHVARAYRVSSVSMEPSLLVDDWLLAAASRRPPMHDRIVIYRRSGGSYVKRVVGLGGDTLAMRERRVYRNGEAIEEPYASYDDSEVTPSAAAWGPLLVPAGALFVMGDNRNHALDSRHFGFVDADSAIGEVVRIYYSRDPRTGAVRWERVGKGVR